MSNIAYLQGDSYNKAMSTKVESPALGGYLRTLREKRGLKPKEVLAQLTELFGGSMDQTRFYRAEKGTAWPTGDFLVALLGIIRGDLEDVIWLQAHPDATLEDGVARAEYRLTEEQKRKLDPLLATDEGSIEFLRSVFELSDNPELRGRVRGYLDGVKSGQT